MPASQREVAFKSIQITRQCLDITVKSDSYREGMKYGKSSECHVSAWSLKLFQLSTIPMLPLRLLPLFFFASHGYCKLFSCR